MKRGENMSDEKRFHRLLIVHIVITAAFTIFVASMGRKPENHALADVMPMLLAFFVIRLFTDKYKKLLPLAIGLVWGGIRYLQYAGMFGIFGADENSFAGQILNTEVYFSDVIACAVGVFMLYLFLNYEGYERNEIKKRSLANVSDGILFLAVIFAPPLGLVLLFLKGFDVQNTKGKHSTVGSTISLVFLQAMLFMFCVLMLQMQIAVIEDRFRLQLQK